MTDPWATKSRTEEVVEVRTATHTHRYRVLNRLTVDDLMANLAKAEAHLIYTGEDLTYYPDRKIKDYLVKNTVLVG